MIARYIGFLWTTLSKMRELRIHLCALALWAATSLAIAAGPTQPTGNNLRHTFTTEDGLPLNVVNAVLQTRDGFLIVGTANGMARFDGHRFAEMNSDPPQDIVARSLAEGPDGDLWVATRFDVYRVPHAEIDQQTQNLSVFHLGPGAIDSVKCLRFTRAGVLWAGTPSRQPPAESGLLQNRRGRATATSGSAPMELA
jgi:hypothetical protein